MIKITSKDIEKEQNNPELLKVQFVARKCYNIAEKLNTIAWLLYISEIACLCLKTIDMLKNVVSIMEIIIVVAIAIVVCICSYFVKKAAWLRGFFDEQVLFLEPKNYPPIEGIKIREFVERIIKLSQKSFEIQVANTGKDTPPGVKNWYEFPCYKNGEDAIFECQRQNIWFTKKNVIIKIVGGIIFSIVNIAFFVCAIYYYGIDYDIIMCFLGIGIRYSERVYFNGVFIFKFLKIDGVIESMWYSRNQDAINNLQNNINELRSIPVLGSNYLYTKIVKWLIDLYYKINK